jgi:hypothetical protein
VAKATERPERAHEHAGMCIVRIHICGLLVATLWLLATGALAQTHHHHALHDDFYRHWQRPDVGGSCCNARVVKDGYEEGDCEPTRAEVRNGAWVAWLREQGRWVEIPDSRILRAVNPSPADAHLCWAYDQVLCFLPPHTGG